MEKLFKRLKEFFLKCGLVEKKGKSLFFLKVVGNKVRNK